MKLLGTNEVCEILGISKPTLYRWNNLSDESSHHFENRINLAKLNSKMLSSQAFKSKTQVQSLFEKLQKNEIEEPTPKNFPRPFKIGRAYKWRSDEIENWLETMRI